MDSNLFSCDYILAPGGYHRFILASFDEKSFIRPRLFTIRELYDNAIFKIDDKAVFSLMSHFDLTYEYAMTILDNIYFLSDLPDAKVKKLQEYVNHLSDISLLKTNGYFRIEMNGKKVGVLGYDINGAELNRIAEEYGFSLIPIVLNNEKHPKKILTLLTVEEEIVYFFNKTAAEIDAGRDINTIFLFNPPASYLPMIEIYSRHFGIPVNLPGSTSLFMTPAGQEVFRFVTEKSFEEAKERFSSLGDSYRIIVRLIEEIIGSPLTDKRRRLDYFRSVLTSRKIEKPRYANAVSILSVPHVLKDAYIAVLGMNDGNFPVYKKDNDYLSDRQKGELSRTDSFTENKFANEIYGNFLMSIEDGHFSYPLNVEGKETFPSSVIRSLDLPIENAPVLPFDYSQSMASVLGAALIEKNRVYKKKDPRLHSYRDKLKIPFRKYDYRYRKINRQATLPVNISYSSLNQYFKCKFRYFAERILKTETSEASFHIDFGNLSHGIFETMSKEEISFDEAYEKELTKKEYSKKELVFLEKLKNDLKRASDFNDSIIHEGIKPVLSEVPLSYTVAPDVVLHGKIDKILVVNGKNEQSLALLDYKTGNDDFDDGLIEYGLSMQLPIYSLLVTSLPEYGHLPLVGFYIQNVISKKSTSDDGGSEESLAKSLLWHGLTSSHLDRIMDFDRRFVLESSFIKSLKMKKDGSLFATAKVVDDAGSRNSFESVRELARRKITECADGVVKNDFAIDPKMVNKISTCTFCPFIDICYRPSYLPGQNVVVKKPLKVKEDDK